MTIGNLDPAVRRISHNYIELQPVTEISSLVAMKPWVSKHPETVAAFRDAMIQAAEFANNHDRATREILGKYVALDRNILDTVVLPRFIAGSLNEGLLDETILRMRQAGWIESTFSARDLIYA